jgi:hypothetical protein
MVDDVRYYRVSPRIWSVTRWSENARLLALYLLTCPHRTVEGLFRLPKAYIQADLEWSPQRLAEPLRELSEDGFIEYDEDAQVVLILKALKYQAPANPNGVTSALRQLEEVPESPLDQRFHQMAQRYCERLAEQLPERFAQPPAPPPAPKTPPTPPLRDTATVEPTTPPGGSATPKTETTASRVLDRVVGDAPPDVHRRLKAGLNGHHHTAVQVALFAGWQPAVLVAALSGRWHGVHDPPKALLARLRGIGPAPPDHLPPTFDPAVDVAPLAEASDPETTAEQLAAIRRQLTPTEQDTP